MKELTIIRISASGVTEPYVPPGTDILLIQDGLVQVGKLLHDPDDLATVYIDHPKNQAELGRRAKKIVEKQKPEYLESDFALIVTCPVEISRDVEW